MRGTWEQLIGRTIQAVVTAKNPGYPKSQLFLVFNDGTRYEIFGERFKGANGLDEGGVDAAVRYAKNFGGVVKVIEEATPILDIDAGGKIDT